MQDYSKTFWFQDRYEGRLTASCWSVFREVAGKVEAKIDGKLNGIKFIPKLIVTIDGKVMFKMMSKWVPNSIVKIDEKVDGKVDNKLERNFRVSFRIKLETKKIDFSSKIHRYKKTPRIWMTFYIYDSSLKFFEIQYWSSFNLAPTTTMLRCHYRYCSCGVFSKRFTYIEIKL